MSLLIVIAHSVVIYVFLVVALSRLGRSQMAGLTPIGYIVIALLGSSVETGLYNGKGSLAAGLASGAAILLMDHIMSRVLRRWRRACRLLVGSPIVLAHEGRAIPSHLRQVRMTEEDLKTAIRKQGYDTLDNIHLAVLEVDGAVGVTPNKSPAKAQGLNE
jgi:uncharacterized membrane protein YcaP (DUF421 family)